MKNIEEIKKEIQTINPYITDEVLDLLFEYVEQRLRNELKSTNRKISNNSRINNAYSFKENTSTPFLEEC